MGENHIDDIARHVDEIDTSLDDIYSQLGNVKDSLGRIEEHLGLQPMTADDVPTPAANPIPEPRQIPVTTKVRTQRLFLLSASVMNCLALAGLNDPGLDPETANEINERQQWLSGCDWPILGWDTSDAPEGAAVIGELFDPDIWHVVLDIVALMFEDMANKTPWTGYTEGELSGPKGYLVALGKTADFAKAMLELCGPTT